MRCPWQAFSSGDAALSVDGIALPLSLVGRVKRSVTQHRLESMLSFTLLTHNLQTKYLHHEIAQQRLVVNRTYAQSMRKSVFQID